MPCSFALAEKALERAGLSRSDGIAAVIGALRCEHDAAGGEFGESFVKRLRPSGRVDGTQLGGGLAVYGDDDGAAFAHLLHQCGQLGFGFVERVFVWHIYMTSLVRLCLQGAFDSSQ